MSELTKPNAFVFKAFIDNEYKLCVCPRINNKWSEADIVYIQDYDGAFDDVLHEKYFSVLFVGYEKTDDTNGKFTLKNVNAQYIKSQNGKGSSPRPVNKKTYNSNYDKINWGDKKKSKSTEK